MTLDTASSTAPNEKAVSPVTTLPLYAKDKPKEVLVRSRFRRLYHALAAAALTAYFIAAMVLRKPVQAPGMLILIYIFIILKLFFAYVSTRYFTRPIGLVWNTVVAKPLLIIPLRARNIIGVLIPLAAITAVALAMPDTDVGTRIQRVTSLCGLLVFIALLAATSHSPRNINWRIVVVGVSLQFLLGILILKTKAGLDAFKYIAHLATTFLEFSKLGAAFVFGKDGAELPIFAATVLPGVLFFASFIQIVYYLGAMQWIIKKFAWVMMRLMDTSGSESVVAAASPFVGQGESALLVKPFIQDMTMSELHSTMTSGFATIAGSVLIAFIALKIDSQALITACVMSTPCSLAVSKLRYPEMEVSITKGDVKIPEDEDRESNFLHAAANGATQGVHLCLLIGGTLIAIISLLGLVNALLTYFGSFLGFETLTLPMIARYAFLPFAWLIGIPSQDVMTVGSLMATKMFVNEFAAYIELASLAEAGAITLRSQLLTTFALCGFANCASIGIQIGCIGAMSPNRKGDLAKLAVSAMLCGTMSTFMTATIAGILL